MISPERCNHNVTVLLFDRSDRIIAEMYQDPTAGMPDITRL